MISALCNISNAWYISTIILYPTGLRGLWLQLSKSHIVGRFVSSYDSITLLAANALPPRLGAWTCQSILLATTWTSPATFTTTPAYYHNHRWQTINLRHIMSADSTNPKPKTIIVILQCSHNSAFSAFFFERERFEANTRPSRIRTAVKYVG